MRLLKKALTYGLLVLGLSVSTSVLASDFEETKARAEKGDTLAQYSLAMTYEHGRLGIRSDPEKAIELYKKTANKGNSSAAYRLGEIYENGINVKQDDTLAFEWYQRSAQLGDIAAQSRVGLMYENGTGVRQDYDKAFTWYQKLAYPIISTHRPDLDAMYDKSDGSKVEWYKKSANQGNYIAQSILGFLYLNGEGVQQSKAQAKNWFGKACDQNVSMSCNIYRVLQHPGYVIDKNTPKILSYNSDVALHHNAKHGNTGAQYALGKKYYLGKEVPQNHSKAFELLQSAAENGSTGAQFSVGTMYYRGEGTPQNYAKAFDWYHKATEFENPHPTAQYNLGLMYYQGKGVPQNYAKAFDWFQKAANNKGMFVTLFDVTPNRGDVLAQYALGSMYDEGKGVRQDKAEAKEWFGKSCDNGLQAGCDNYKILN